MPADSAGSDKARRSRPGRYFFAGFAIAVAVTVLIGFSRTYYFKTLSAAPPLPVLFHIHGALFTSWVLLFITQAFLVARSSIARACLIQGRFLRATGPSPLGRGDGGCEARTVRAPESSGRAEQRLSFRCNPRQAPCF